MSHPTHMNGRPDLTSLASTPASSTPTIDVSFEHGGPLGSFSHTFSPSHAHAQQQILWPHRLSASFSAMADQIAAASQALALVPPTAFSGSDAGAAELGALRSRMETIEQTQARMMAELNALRMQQGMNGHVVNGGDANGIATVEVDGEGDKTDPVTAKLEELEKKLNELSDVVKLEQQRLPVRLHNSRATMMKASLKTPIASNGKPVAGFPTTRGEFEHITKERYEALLKSYGLGLKGDTDAKRESLRMFAGIPQDGQ